MTRASGSDDADAPPDARHRPTDYAALVGLDEAHTLEPAERSRTTNGSTERETRWLLERDADGDLVARYRTWLVRSSRAPFRRELGWERWSPAGELLDREVRYSTRASRLAMH